MHEFSLASSMINTVLEIASENKVSKILKINLKFGKFALVEEEQFRFCIDLLKREHEMTIDMEVVISWEDGIIECLDCKYLGPSEIPEDAIGMLQSFKCPDCKTYRTKIVQGMQSDIENISVSA